MRTGTAAAVAGLCGFATMCLELTAVRLLAPHFGDSAYVWTNVIGVILAALAIGAFWGGRMADQLRGERRLALLLGGAALLVAAAPLLAGVLGGFLVPGDLPLDRALPALVRGSLAASVVLFGLPVLLLGAVTPMLAVLLAASTNRLGRSIGTVSALATAGSLLGTFAATHLLVPMLGCRVTLWACAVVLAACTLLVGRRGSGAVAMLLVLGSLLLHGGPPREPRSGRELLAWAETQYQYLQVTRQRTAEGELTELQINEGLDSFHSVMLAGSAFTGGRYYDWHVAAPWLAGDGQRPPGLRVLSVGDAAGTFGRIYQAVHPGVVVDGVELDPKAVELGARWFGGRTAKGTTWAGLDGRVAVARAASRYHVVLLDAYAHQVYIPAHLASREFFAAVRDRLEDGGVVSVNVGGLHFGDPVVGALARTMAHVFSGAVAFRVPDSRNFVLMARKGKELAPEVLASLPSERSALAEPDKGALKKVLEGMAVPAAWHRYGAEGSPLVDDRPELDLLLHRSYVAAAAEAGLVATTGSNAVDDAEAAAYRALQAQDLQGVLAAVAASREATAYLRLLCGDARWQLRDLRGAADEYRAALLLRPGHGQRDLAKRQQDLAVELETASAAEAAATRNGWLAAGAVIAGLVLAAALLRAA